MPILRDWNIHTYYSQTHQKEMTYLTGKVYNDKRFSDETNIRTSAVLEMKDGTARTQNTTYILAKD